MPVAEHVAVDGSLVTIETRAADLSGPASTTGWAVSPALLRAHPFTVHPPGYGRAVEEFAREASELTIGDRDEVEVAGGSLQVAVITVAVPPGGERTMTVGYWEGRTGSVSTGIAGKEVTLLTEVFETLDIRQTSRGAFIGAPIVARPRPPLVVKAVPTIGVLAIRPAIAQVLDELPREPGMRTAQGEVFRTRAEGVALTFIGRTSVVSINPNEDAAADAVVGLAEDLRVEWALRAA